MDNNNFDFQVIASGSYIDDNTGAEGLSFMVQTFLLRLNHIALNQWILAHAFNSRDTYDTDAEWEDYLSTVKTRQDKFTKAITDALGINRNRGSVCINQAQAEVMSVVFISKTNGDYRLVPDIAKENTYYDGQATSINNLVGNNIRLARTAAGYTQADLAKLINTNSVQISRYERGERPITVDLLYQFENVLHLPIGSLLKNSNQ